jgi:hypothetical protein
MSGDLESIKKRLKTLSPSNLVTGANSESIEREIISCIDRYNLSQSEQDSLWADFVSQLLFSGIIYKNVRGFRDAVFALAQSKGFSEQALLAKELKINQMLEQSRQEKPRAETNSGLARVNQVVQSSQITELQDQTTLQPDRYVPTQPSQAIDQQAQRIYPGHSLWGRAEKIASVFEANGLKVQILEPCNTSPRCDQFHFRKEPATKFNQFRSLVLEAISNAGYDPSDGMHSDAPLLEMADNTFALQVIRPVEEWQSLSWMGINEQIPDRELKETIQFLRGKLAQESWETPRVRIGVLTNGKLADCALSTSAFIFGDSDSGKSVVVKNICLGIALALTPQQVTIDLMDFKGGLSFGTLYRLPHVRSFIHDGINPRTGEMHTTEEIREEAQAVFTSLEQDVRDRKKAFLEAGLESIQEYNQRFPNKAFQWRFVFMGECRKGKEWLSDEIFNPTTKEIVTQWRAFGIIFVGDTQYPNMADSFGPDVRSSFGTKIALKLIGQGAELMFKGSPLLKIIPLLAGKGDFIHNQLGRGQGFYLSNDLIKRIIPVLNELYQPRVLGQSRSLGDDINNWQAMTSNGYASRHEGNGKPVYESVMALNDVLEDGFQGDYWGHDH